jgi:3-dehydroquinate synthase
MPRIEVATPSARYAITVERGALRRVADIAAEAGLTPTRVAVLVDAALVAKHGATVEQSWSEAGARPVRLPVRAGEEHKTLSAVEALCRGMLEAGLDRRSAVVAVGGGVVGDTAGFAAAVFMRGIACVQVPTTLLAMVDAAIGGKTGVNLPRPDGTLAKNMVGAFWQPRAVVCDPDALRTLDARELRCGLAECVKHAIIADASLMAWMVAAREALLARDADALAELVLRSASIKARVVAADEREDGVRAHLNLGHTFAHAIEALAHGEIRHGEAVAIGLVAAARLGEATGVAAPGLRAEIEGALVALGLPARLPAPLPVAALLAAMRADKKNVAGALRLVVPFAAGDVRVVEGASPRAVEEAWASVGAVR